ncbi:hydroxysqualene dehydroxylase HpnE [Palleronia abyssalis]|uniref:Amine oxidase domain-containing protein n=1 Tax=Palleronia abyssalis TaxID=1501240 RepID=A0A2R8BYR5_9RHOB|nr:hydroxysqualene dehydroxylase HpnE [Palleronia abyssalis]SPJ25290.1 hypothetical protein PAA8504_03141 [Palleronia abyssalis]
MGRVFVLGAGLAGLVAAERLSAEGREVVLIEATPKAGGRCRSYRDERLGRTIDNGNHLVLSCNTAVLDWARRIGGDWALTMGQADFPFIDLAADRRWRVELPPGPFGALSARARPPGVALGALAADMARLITSGPRRTVAEVSRSDTLRDLFWDPMCRAILNEPPETGSAALLRAAIMRSFARGSRSAQPVFAPDGLGPALIDPALRLLGRRGIVPRYREPVSTLSGRSRLEVIKTTQDRIDIGEGDVAILAVPVRQAASLLPHLQFPPPGRTILNAHFLCPDNGLPPLLGVVGGATHWLFRRGDVVSVTVSAEEASSLSSLPRYEALSLLWADVARAIASYGGTVPPAMPASRLLREKAATFDQSPAGAALRPPSRTAWPNLFLAGDFVRTGLPATLEGAVQSGLRAAGHVLRTP